MPESRTLPLHPYFSDTEAYINSLLAFATSCELFQKLCGGVHILDFLTKEPDLYSSVLPDEWRSWFSLHKISDILDLLLREDLDKFELDLSLQPNLDTDHIDDKDQFNGASFKWRGHPFPPASLLEYIQTIRKHCLDRTFRPRDKNGFRQNSVKNTQLSRDVSVGMKPKKIHEVENFAKYIDNLSSEIALTSSHNVTHLVDFGSGQNYLGRALASSPYNRSVIAIESKLLNIDGAKTMDVLAKLTQKEKIMRNKKLYRREVGQGNINSKSFEVPLTTPIAKRITASSPNCQSPADAMSVTKECGGIQYIEHLIEDGDLSIVIDQIQETSTALQEVASSRNHEIPSSGELKPLKSLGSNPRLMVISLHSCGNLIHHGLRSLILTPSVKAVAMVGCCYNLVTERLGPPTYKIPSLRSFSRRLDRTSSACDPHGFPMSERLAKFKVGQDEGVRFNITARMMAVQAPQNWTSTDCDSFFTRHFYRALLQRILLDRGIVGKPGEEGDLTVGVSPRGWTGIGEPILIGSLRKSCYESFPAYVHGALTKLVDESKRGREFANCMTEITNEELLKYEENYKEKKKELSIAWSLMAFSAEVVESIIVVDRWLYLREQAEVKDCWVEAVFDYKYSPRNLAVVGIKE